MDWCCGYESCSAPRCCRASSSLVRRRPAFHLMSKYQLGLSSSTFVTHHGHAFAEPDHLVRARMLSLDGERLMHLPFSTRCLSNARVVGLFALVTTTKCLHDERICERSTSSISSSPKWLSRVCAWSRTLPLEGSPGEYQRPVRI